MTPRAGRECHGAQLLARARWRLRFLRPAEAARRAQVSVVASDLAEGFGTQPSADRLHNAAMPPATCVGFERIFQISLALSGKFRKSPVASANAVAPVTTHAGLGDRRRDERRATQGVNRSSRRRFTMHEPPIPGLVKLGQLFQECNNRPDFVVTLKGRPRRHPGKFHAMLHHIEKLPWLQLLNLRGKIRRVRSHLVRYARLRACRGFRGMADSRFRSAFRL